MAKTWDNLLEELIEEPEFKTSIEERGFYKSNVSLKIFAKKYNFQPSQNTATYLSINFWSEQSKILRKNNLYLLRTGSGTFGIFDENVFPSPYLQLDTTNSEKLDLNVNDDFKELMDAFDTRQENAGLEHLNACGVYDSLIEKLFGDKIEIKLFKYIEKLEAAIFENPPDVLALSNYVWCHRISLEMFRILKQKNPLSLTVWGGPNFPLDFPSQTTFFKNCPDLDIYVIDEGEDGFSNIIEKPTLNYPSPHPKND